jgi:hypothetical protein
MQLCIGEIGETKMEMMTKEKQEHEAKCEAIELELITLINLGNDALVGLICNQCGRQFRKAVGHVRICSKCKNN